MNRIILSLLNAPIFLLLVVIGIALQTSLFVSYPFIYLQPDFVLLAMVWCALRRDFYEGGFLTLLFGYVAELHSGSPQGIFMLVYILVYLLIRSSFKIFTISGVKGMIAVTLGATLAWRVLFLILLALLGVGEHQYRYTFALAFPNAVINATVCVFIFKWLDFLDKKTFKNPQARQMLNDSLQVEGEGL